MRSSQQKNAKSMFQAERIASAQTSEGRLKSCQAFLFSSLSTVILEAGVGIHAKYCPCFPSKVPPVIYKRGLFAKLPCVLHCHAARLLLTLSSESLELLFLRIGRGERYGEVISFPWVRRISSSLPKFRSPEAGVRGKFPTWEGQLDFRSPTLDPRDPPSLQSFIQLAIDIIF